MPWFACDYNRNGIQYPQYGSETYLPLLETAVRETGTVLVPWYPFYFDSGVALATFALFWVPLLYAVSLLGSEMTQNAAWDFLPVMVAPTTLLLVGLTFTPYMSTGFSLGIGFLATIAVIPVWLVELRIMWRMRRARGPP